MELGIETRCNTLEEIKGSRVSKRRTHIKYSAKQRQILKENGILWEGEDQRIMFKMKTTKPPIKT